MYNVVARAAVGCLGPGQQDQEFFDDIAKRGLGVEDL